MLQSKIQGALPFTQEMWKVQESSIYNRMEVDWASEEGWMFGASKKDGYLVV